MNQPLDLLDVGLGPFNLSLAALAAESGAVNYAFLDRNASFRWHPDMLLPSAYRDPVEDPSKITSTLTF